MGKPDFDLIVIGAGSAGLGASLVPAKFGLKVLQIVKTDHDVGGECLNDGCVPSKALIHLSKVAYQARETGTFGLQVSGSIDIDKVTRYVKNSQTIIRKHENAKWLEEQGVTVVLGTAKFHSKNAIEVNGEIYTGKYIIIATGSRPIALDVPGAELVVSLNNESIFHIDDLPQKLLVVGAGPIGIELGQAFHRLGSQVTFIQRGGGILPHEDPAISDVLKDRLEAEGIEFKMNSSVDHFPDAKKAIIKSGDGSLSSVSFDAVLVAIGRKIELAPLSLEKAGIKTENGKIKVDHYLRTTNPKVFVAGDIAGSLIFSHAAEQHVRLLMNNFFSPFKKKLNNDYMSWVTFTDPEVATFGLNEKELVKRKTSYKRLEMDFKDDDRAITDSYRYGKLILFITRGSLFKKKVILGGSMAAPNAGEMIQELILANYAKLDISRILNKVYPYPVSSRVNQKILTDDYAANLTETLKKLLRFLFGKFIF
ncbi:MAG TPA: FAD-dependent oxidoreductase [Mucilaginibacter sp.]|jgi:pyruvate/2-oxoglutarate dehydrogenase complex dihydrolipoamide dehydrogenase (E3) component